MMSYERRKYNGSTIFEVEIVATESITANLPLKFRKEMCFYR